MVTNPQQVHPASPTLIDAAILPIRSRLEVDFTWLKTYGPVERLVRESGSKAIHYPAVYTGDNQYLSLLPDSHLGTYAFFDIKDPVGVVGAGLGQPGQLRIGAGIVFWLDFTQVFPADHETQSLDNILDMVLRSLSKTRMEVTAISRQTKNIYRDYTADEIRSQFRMRPYGAFRIDGNLIYTQNHC